LAWVAARVLIVHQEIQKADVIVVLGGSSTYIERTRKAAQLWKEGHAPKIFLTNDGTQGGWSNEERRNPYFVERAKKELLQQGVREDAIEVLPQIVSSTQDEVLLLKKILPEKKVRSVLFVTSPYHTRRALRTMKRAFAENGIDIGITSPPTGEQSPRPYFWWLSLQGWNLVGGEYVKLIYYWLFY
jgi:uncharacterized SAM-binding protein YcdF (DUF218 family)